MENEIVMDSITAYSDSNTLIDKLVECRLAESHRGTSFLPIAHYLRC